MQPYLPLALALRGCKTSFFLPRALSSAAINSSAFNLSFTFSVAAGRRETTYGAGRRETVFGAGRRETAFFATQPTSSGQGRTEAEAELQKKIRGHVSE